LKHESSPSGTPQNLREVLLITAIPLFVPITLPPVPDSYCVSVFMLYCVAGNTFIFSDGTVVQQEDGSSGGDILLYVLDPADVTIDPGY
jgi:hypothetical protein